MIFSRTDVTISNAKGEQKSISDLIDRAVFPGLQGGPHMNQIAAIAVTLKEADTPAFKKYAAQVKKNAKVLAEELQKKGWKIISGGTDSHLILVDTWMNGKGVSGKEASDLLEKAGIIVNKNTIPNETRSPMDPSGIRLGTAAETTRGKKEKDMKKIAEMIDMILRKTK
jgi:glycine hydroxymethyltransferase